MQTLSAVLFSNGEGSAASSRVFLAIGITFAVMGLAVIVAMLIPWLLERFDGEAPDVEPETQELQILPPFSVYSDMVEEQENRFRTYLRRYAVVGKHSAGKDHQAGAKQQDAKQGKMIREWADSQHGQGITPQTGRPASHRKDK